jgi:hypothetical protein
MVWEDAMTVEGAVVVVLTTGTAGRKVGVGADATGVGAGTGRSTGTGTGVGTGTGTGTGFSTIFSTILSTTLGDGAAAATVTVFFGFSTGTQDLLTVTVLPPVSTGRNFCVFLVASEASPALTATTAQGGSHHSHHTKQQVRLW